MTTHIRLLGLCMLALSGCMTEYKLISDSDDGPDGGNVPGGDGDGDGDGDAQSGPDGSLGPSDGDGDGESESTVCARNGLCRRISVTNVDRVDLLFMIDNSASMEQEQESLRVEFPRLINILSSGDRNGDGLQDFPPAKDIHFGVVSSDLGLPGLEGSNIQGCTGLGDEGRLLNRSNPELDAMGWCSASTFDQPFLAYSAANVDSDGRTQLANDLACIASLGVDGCGFEQQLDSMLKAVWPGSDPRVSFVTDTAGNGMYGMAGPGFPNGEFIRSDVTQSPSLISLVMVTDEEDCLSRSMEHFASPNGPNTRCYYESLRGSDSNLFQVERYIEAFKALRPNRRDLVLFDAIVGVPTALLDESVIGDIDFDNAAERDAFYSSLLDDPHMQEAVDDNGTPELLLDDTMVPSCDRGESAKAYPPRRIVQVARGLGESGMVHSICQDDFGGPISSIVDRISAHLGSQCLAQPIEHDGNRIACDVYWELPAQPLGDAPTQCDQRDFLSSAGRSSADRALCKVTQLEVVDGNVSSSRDGFYYDDFSAEAQQDCAAASSQTRIAFTTGAMPPAGVDIWLNCD